MVRLTPRETCGVRPSAVTWATICSRSCSLALGRRTMIIQRSVARGKETAPETGAASARVALEATASSAHLRTRARRPLGTKPEKSVVARVRHAHRLAPFRPAVNRVVSGSRNIHERPRTVSHPPDRHRVSGHGARPGVLQGYAASTAPLRRGAVTR